MIISLIAISCFRGSPIFPAGAALSKPYYVWCAESGTVHSKLLAKKSKLQARKLSQNLFISKFRMSTKKASPVLCLVLSAGSAHTATLAVTGEPPRVQPPSDPNPPLQDGVGAGLSGLYDTGLGGTPLMLSVCPNVTIIVLVARLVVMMSGRSYYVPVSENQSTRSTCIHVGNGVESCALIGRRDSARVGAVQSAVVQRWSPTLDINDDPRVARHSDPNNRPSGLTTNNIVTTHDPVISMILVLRCEND